MHTVSIDETVTDEHAAANSALFSTLIPLINPYTTPAIKLSPAPVVLTTFVLKNGTCINLPF